MASQAEPLRDLDTEAHNERAWIFWAITTVLTGALLVNHTPTRALGRGAGWAISGFLFAGAVLYIARLKRVRGQVHPTETLVSALAAVVMVGVGQWLAGGLRSPLSLVLELHVFGAAAVLQGRPRGIHLLAVLAAVVAPLIYGPAGAAAVLTTAVYAVMLIVQAGFLLDYGRRLRAHRLALYRAEREASAHALTDMLTALGNRRALELELDEAAVRARAGQRLSLVYIDLDGFKAYNDEFGHEAGDSLLSRLGRALGAVATPHGKAFRIGGDEFCAILDGSQTEEERLLGEIQVAMTEHGPDYAVVPSCGLARVPEDVDDVRAALRLADERMYGAKRAGRQRSDVRISASAAALEAGHELLET
ncbi:MAG TPA: GGDEF domain-containing protein [Solirubrobacteraceae bacterium]|nr:GGDEF domain-containing protein [Solirubrobacteraceae bacterium]